MKHTFTGFDFRLRPRQQRPGAVGGPSRGRSASPSHFQPALWCVFVFLLTRIEGEIGLFRYRADGQQRLEISSWKRETGSNL